MTGETYGYFTDLYYREVLRIVGETNSIELTIPRNTPPIYIDFVDVKKSKNITRDKISITQDTYVSELVITVEDNSAWLRYKINGGPSNNTGASLLKNGEDRIVRPMHPRAIRAVLLYAVTNTDDPNVENAVVRLNCLI